MNPTIASLFKVGILKDVQILVVDNDVDSGVLYTIFLQNFGANVIATNSIKKALKSLNGFVPHIIICEIRFLDENVYTLLNKLTEMEAFSKKHIPIIVTSTCTKGTIEQIPEIEFEGYLLKPIDLDKLFVMIESLVPLDRKNLLADKLKQLFVDSLDAANSLLMGIQFLGLTKDYE
ncbi:response regulator [Anabaena subtropica]|uniref:Response regulator n=1 Tax=Anabaena subtropica FACHB-260 TaxID=2692884 RepID=A0ABR8CQK8_9NOST|nr:response regulator [Anabaena subtropica]MBD2344750.1 response regulator [Anabaena subtropica FACHB-260]